MLGVAQQLDDAVAHPHRSDRERSTPDDGDRSLRGDTRRRRDESASEREGLGLGADDLDPGEPARIERPLESCGVERRAQDPPVGERHLGPVLAEEEWRRGVGAASPGLEDVDGAAHCHAGRVERQPVLGHELREHLARRPAFEPHGAGRHEQRA